MSVIDPGTLSDEQLNTMQEAALEAVECIRVLTKSGGNLVGEVLRGNGEFTEWDHYPPDDIFDPESHTQFYFHAHPPETRDEPDYGHFHTFIRKEGLPKGVRPAKLKPHEKQGNTDTLTHVVAISMTQQGLPERLFTTNRWVTGETWYKAADVIKALDGFMVDLAYPSWPLNRWLSAMVVLYRPHIEQLLHERDAVVEERRAELSNSNVFEDRALEITSQMHISLFDQIEWLDGVLDSRGLN
jgi:hypothetical protein